MGFKICQISFILFIIFFTMVNQSLGESEVEIILEKDNFCINEEKICFSILNRTSDILVLPSPAPWKIVKNSEIIYSPIVPQVLVKVPPIRNLLWCWNMRDNDGNKVGYGRYEIWFYYNKNKISKSFHIY